MFKQTMIGLAGAAALGVGFAGSADAASFNFEWNFRSSDDFFQLTGMVDGDLGADGKVRNLSNLMATFTDGITSYDFDTVTDANSFFALDGSEVSLGFGGTSFGFEGGSEVIDGTTSLVGMQDLLAGTLSADVLGEANSITLSALLTADECNNGETTCSFVAIEKPVGSVPEPASMLGLLTIGAVAAGGALKKKAFV